ncbi:MAG: hypothetical protein E6767_07005 [Dysgonomonas sp.]|nr:hypothetical protein [Dysgonomonas sp.]
MKKLIFCCIFLFILIACSENKSIMGRWAIEIEGTNETSILMFNDTVVCPELQINYDTIYMETKSDGVITDSQFVGIYSIHGDEIRAVDRYGKEQICRFVLEDDILIIYDKDNPDKIMMRLRRIKES